MLRYSATNTLRILLTFSTVSIWIMSLLSSTVCHSWGKGFDIKWRIGTSGKKQFSYSIIIRLINWSKKIQYKVYLFRILYHPISYQKGHITFNTPVTHSYHIYFKNAVEKLFTLQKTHKNIFSYLIMVVIKPA